MAPRNDRNDRAAHLKPAALFGEPRLHAAAGFQAERRAARQREGIDPLHRVGEIEQRALAGAGAAAAHVDRRHRRRIENHRGDAGCKRRVVGMTDANARYIGEEIFHYSSSRRGSERVLAWT